MARVPNITDPPQPVSDYRPWDVHKIMDLDLGQLSRAQPCMPYRTGCVTPSCRALTEE